MGATSSVDEAQFNALKNTVNSQASKINALDALKSKVDNLSTAAASGIEYTKLAEAINKEANYRENLAVAIAKNPNDLGANLASEIGKNNSIIENLNSKLAASTTLQDKVADALSSNDKYKERIRGPKGVDGSIGDQASLESNLFDKGNTMWCADGELCKIPQGKKGIDWGYGASKIIDDAQLRIMTDDNIHFHVGNKEALHIDSNRVKTDRLDIGGWTIQEEGNHLVFKRGNAQQGAGNQAHLRMAADGNFWLSRSTGPGWVADNMMRTDRDYGIKVAGNGQWADMGKTHSDKNYHWVKVKFESF